MTLNLKNNKLLSEKIKIPDLPKECLFTIIKKHTNTQKKHEKLRYYVLMFDGEQTNEIIMK